MNMDRLFNKKVVKKTVGDLKEELKDVDDDKEVVLSFMLKDDGAWSVYLAEIYTAIKYDSVIQNRSDDVIELVGFVHDKCQYMERKDDS